MSNKYINVLSDKVSINDNKLIIQTDEITFLKNTKYNVVSPNGVLKNKLNNRDSVDNNFVFKVSNDYITPIICDFVGVTNLTGLRNVLNDCGKDPNDITLLTNAQFNYSNGVSIRSGSIKTETSYNYNNLPQPLVFKNCAIPKSIYLKAHTTQNNYRTLNIINIKVGNSLFDIIKFMDNNASNVGRSNLGLIVDKASSPVIALIKSYNTIDYTLDISNCPNFLNWIGDNKTCDIVYQSMQNYTSNVITNGTEATYPFYLEQLKIKF